MHVKVEPFSVDIAPVADKSFKSIRKLRWDNIPGSPF